jgi:hypothetical protein
MRGSEAEKTSRRRRLEEEEAVISRMAHVNHVSFSFHRLPSTPPSAAAAAFTSVCSITFTFIVAMNATGTHTFGVKKSEGQKKKSSSSTCGCDSLIMSFSLTDQTHRDRRAHISWNVSVVFFCIGSRISRSEKKVRRKEGKIQLSL